VYSVGKQWAWLTAKPKQKNKKYLKKLLTNQNKSDIINTTKQREVIKNVTDYYGS
jgi:hypothetical protein